MTDVAEKNENSFFMNKKVSKKDGKEFYSKKIGEGKYANLQELDDGSAEFRMNGNKVVAEKRSKLGDLFCTFGEDTLFLRKMTTKFGECYKATFMPSLATEGGSVEATSAFAPKPVEAQPKAAPQKYKNTSFKRS